MAKDKQAATVPSKESGKPHWHGHRQRVKKRFLSLVEAHATDTLADYELLELILFSALPRTDVKPLAKSLIERFGSLGGVISASPQALATVPGLQEGSVIVLKTIQAAISCVLRREILQKTVLTSWDQLIEYCHATMAFNEVEHFRILFLDRQNCLIADETQQRGTIDQAPVYPREVIKRALEIGASALLLVHNHPGGDSQPSRADLDMTRRIHETALPLGITLHDHIIIARTGHYSFKTNGLL